MPDQHLEEVGLVSDTATDCELEVRSKMTAYPLPFTAQIESNYDETIDSFDNMNLKEELVRGIYNHGFERPSAVQQRVIGPVVEGERSDGSNRQAAHQSVG